MGGGGGEERGQPSRKAREEGDTHSSIKKPKMICTNLMGRNFLGCPWRAHDEVNVSHEFVIEHQRVPASEGTGTGFGEKPR